MSRVSCGKKKSLCQHLPGGRACVPRRSENGARRSARPDAAAFKLYDTFGLAIDEQEEMAREFGLQIDREGFDTEMDRQRERARASWKGGDKAQVAPIYQELHASHPTQFIGYDTLEHDANVVALLIDHKLVDELPAGVDGEVVLDQTPFYAEAGGQVGDQGALYDDTGDTRSPM